MTAGEAKNVDNAVVLARLFNEASGQKAPSKKHCLFISRPLKVPTFYSWKKKYSETEAPVQEGFCKITPKREVAERSLRLPSGLRLDLVGLSTTEIAELILEIDRAHA